MRQSETTGSNVATSQPLQHQFGCKSFYERNDRNNIDKAGTDEDIFMRKMTGPMKIMVDEYSGSVIC